MIKPSTFQGFQDMHLENKARIRSREAKVKYIKGWLKRGDAQNGKIGKQHDAAVEMLLHGLRVFDAKMEDDNWSGVLHQLRTQPSGKHIVCKR